MGQPLLGTQSNPTSHPQLARLGQIPPHPLSPSARGQPEDKPTLRTNPRSGRGWSGHAAQAAAALLQGFGGETKPRGARGSSAEPRRSRDHPSDQHSPDSEQAEATAAACSHLLLSRTTAGGFPLSNPCKAPGFLTEKIALTCAMDLSSYSFPAWVRGNLLQLRPEKQPAAGQQPERDHR